MLATANQDGGAWPPVRLVECAGGDVAARWAHALEVLLAAGRESPEEDERDG